MKIHRATSVIALAFSLMLFACPAAEAQSRVALLEAHPGPDSDTQLLFEAMDGTTIDFGQDLESAATLETLLQTLKERFEVDEVETLVDRESGLQRGTNKIVWEDPDRGELSLTLLSDRTDSLGRSMIRIELALSGKERRVLKLPLGGSDIPVAVVATDQEATLLLALLPPSHIAQNHVVYVEATDLTILEAPDPWLPDSFRKLKGIQGVMIFQAQVDETGTVEAVRGLKHLPYGPDRQAIEKLKAVKFAPYIDSKGRPRKVRANFVFSYIWPRGSERPRLGFPWETSP